LSDPADTVTRAFRFNVLAFFDLANAFRCFVRFDRMGRSATGFAFPVEPADVGCPLSATSRQAG